MNSNSNPIAFRYPPSALVRRHGPAGYSDYASFRPWLRDDFSFRRVYCLIRERWGRFTRRSPVCAAFPRSVETQPNEFFGMNAYEVVLVVGEAHEHAAAEPRHILRGLTTWGMTNVADYSLSGVPVCRGKPSRFPETCEFKTSSNNSLVNDPVTQKFASNCSVSFGLSTKLGRYAFTYLLQDFPEIRRL